MRARSAASVAADRWNLVFNFPLRDLLVFGLDVDLLFFVRKGTDHALDSLDWGV